MELERNFHEAFRTEHPGRQAGKVVMLASNVESIQLPTHLRQQLLEITSQHTLTNLGTANPIADSKRLTDAERCSNTYQ